MSNSFAREVLAAYAHGQESPDQRERIRDRLFGNEPNGSPRDHPCCVVDFRNGGAAAIAGLKGANVPVALLLGAKVQKHLAPETVPARLVRPLGFPNPRNDEDNVLALKRLAELKALLLPYIRRP